MKTFVIALAIAWIRPIHADIPPAIRVEASRDAMGGTFTVVAYHADRNRAEGAIGQALEEAARLDHLLSNYRPSSEWSKVNRQAAQGPVAVSEELYALLKACQSYSAASDGAFDITVGPLMKIWGFYKRDGKIPHRAEIRTAMENVGYRQIQLDDRDRTVRFARSGVEMDPGGIGKGYAVDRMVEVLKQEGITSAFITAATSSTYGLGSPPSEKRGWRVSIRHPREASKQVEEVFLRDQSLSTSGSQEKFFEAGGRIYSHIMNPATGYPSEGRLQVSVLAPRTIDSEAWTKPIFIHGRQWAAQRKPKDLRAYICEDTRELSCAWLQ